MSYHLDIRRHQSGIVSNGSPNPTKLERDSVGDAGTAVKSCQGKINVKMLQTSPVARFFRNGPTKVFHNQQRSNRNQE